MNFLHKSSEGLNLTKFTNAFMGGNTTSKSMAFGSNGISMLH
jgi:hypothetical protein